MVDLSLTSHGQTLQVTIDEGQTIALGCSLIFTGEEVFPPFFYAWHLAGNFTPISTNPTYIVAPDSDVSYKCVASARDLRANIVLLTGIIDIIVRGTYIIYY